MALAADLRGSTVQALRDDLRRRRAGGTVLLVTALRWPTAELVTPAALLAVAARAWGHRVAQGFSEIGFIGPRITWPGRAPVEARVLAAVMRLIPPAALTQQPRIGLCLPAHDLGQLRALHQEAIQDRILLAL